MIIQWLKSIKLDIHFNHNFHWALLTLFADICRQSTEVTAPTGVLTSSYYPYWCDVNTDCPRTGSADDSKGGTIVIAFTRLSVEYDINCELDFVEVSQNIWWKFGRFPLIRLNLKYIHWIFYSALANLTNSSKLSYIENSIPSSTHVTNFLEKTFIDEWQVKIPILFMAKYIFCFFNTSARVYNEPYMILKVPAILS